MLRHRWSKKLWILIPIALAMPSACKQKESRKSDPPLPEVSYTKETVLIEAGLSSQPAFSPKGDRLLFVSAKRSTHAQAQVYEKNLSSGEETRITFQNGEVSHPVYHPKEDFILYSSSTDELKENPPLLRPSTAASILPPAFQEPVEIYLHSLSGLEITRLTESPGFDGEARFTNDGKQITWTRARQNKLETMQMNRSSRVAKMLPKLGLNSSGYTVSPDGKWQAWIEWDASFGVSKLKLQKGKAEPVELTSDAIVPKSDAEFSPDSKWLFWAQLNTVTGTFQIWSYELETSCARVLTDNKEGDRRHPTLSPDLKRLVYSAIVKSKDPTQVQSRILQVGFTAPSGSCAGTP